MIFFAKKSCDLNRPHLKWPTLSVCELRVWDSEGYTPWQSPWATMSLRTLSPNPRYKFTLFILSQPTVHFLLMPMVKFGGLHMNMYSPIATVTGQWIYVRRVLIFTLIGRDAVGVPPHGTMLQYIYLHGVNASTWYVAWCWMQCIATGVNEPFELRCNSWSFLVDLSQVPVTDSLDNRSATSKSKSFVPVMGRLPFYTFKFILAINCGSIASKNFKDR